MEPFLQLLIELTASTKMRGLDFSPGELQHAWYIPTLVSSMILFYCRLTMNYLVNWRDLHGLLFVDCHENNKKLNELRTWSQPKICNCDVPNNILSHKVDKKNSKRFMWYFSL